MVGTRPTGAPCGSGGAVARAVTVAPVRSARYLAGRHRRLGRTAAAVRPDKSPFDVGSQQRVLLVGVGVPLHDEGGEGPVGGEVAERPRRPGTPRRPDAARRRAGTSAASATGTVLRRVRPSVTAMPPDRLERVTDLLLVLLDTPRPLSLREIADRVPGYPDGHGARRQAFERDKRLLRDEGVPVLVEPIDGDDQLGYRVDPDQYYLPELHLGPDEQAALNLAVAGVHLGEPTAGEALTKLGALGTSRHAPAALAVVDLPAAELARLAVLHDALRRQAVVEFPYRGVRRTVDPAGLRFTRGQWYLVGHDRGRGEARTFRVDRMEAAPTAGDPGSAALPADFDAEGAFARDPWRFGTGDEVVVDVLVDAVAAGSVVAELGPAVVAERRPDGSLLVRLAVNDEDALVRWVLGLLDHAEVVAPGDVRQRLVERLATLAGSRS